MEKRCLVIVWKTNAETLAEEDEYGYKVNVNNIRFMKMVRSSKLEAFIATCISNGHAKNSIEILDRSGAKISLDITKDNVKVVFDK